MKVLDVSEIVLPGKTTLQSAFDFVFSETSLKKLHGPTTKVSPWSSRSDKEKEVQNRTIKFEIRVDNVPADVRRFFCGKSMRLTTKQRVDRQDPKTWTIENRVRMHFMGAEFFRVKPTFVIVRSDDGVVRIGGRIEHHAMLPPPLNVVAENFMKAHSAREIDGFVAAVTEMIVAESLVGESK